MRVQRSRLDIQNQTKQILTNISQTKKVAKVDKIRAKGHFLVSEAKENGFKKVGWDVYQRPADIDAGQIWSVESIDGDDWLVCYTDSNDHILRNLAKAASDHLLSKQANTIKKASDVLTPETGYALKPGDLAEITPTQPQSINAKYNGLKGEVHSAMPDRSELLFGDGSKLWVENKDLTPIVDSKEMEIGNSVRMFSNNVSGKITKISRDGEYIAFQHETTGQVFYARKGDIVKTSFVFMHSGDLPEDNKAAQKILSDFYKSQQPSMDTPGAESQGMESPGGDAMSPRGKPSPNGTPPSIKQNPSAQEMEEGSSVPAGGLSEGLTPGGMPSNNVLTLADVMPTAAASTKTVKTGRRMNVGDSVQKKSTGEKGTIVDIQFDRKLGKFYLIDFGTQQPEQVYDTDLMKLKGESSGEIDAMPLPSEITPGPTRLIGASIKNAVLDPKFNQVKDAALDFVSGMVSQSLANHEQSNPGTVPPPQLEAALARQAVAVYMSKYLPENLRQTMGADEKNTLSQWLLFETSDTQEDVPTASEFTPEENTAMPAMKTEQEMAHEQVQAHMNSHVKVAVYMPNRFASPIERNRFVRQAVDYLTVAGIDTPTSHFITQSFMANGTIDTKYLRHSLASQLKYEPAVINQLIGEAQRCLTAGLFDTTRGQKYSLDLPGMETLRGGGGGYPGGMDVDPMGWDVKSPQKDDVDPNAVQQSLEEQLMNQSQPFEDAAPKLNIELDSENKQIVIDYNQEEDPVMPIEGAEGDAIPPGEESPNMPSPTGPAGARPGDSTAPGGNASADFSNQDIPVNF